MVPFSPKLKSIFVIIILNSFFWGGGRLLISTSLNSSPGVLTCSFTWKIVLSHLIFLVLFLSLSGGSVTFPSLSEVVFFRKHPLGPESTFLSPPGLWALGRPACSLQACLSRWPSIVAQFAAMPFPCRSHLGICRWGWGPGSWLQETGGPGLGLACWWTGAGSRASGGKALVVTG